MAKRSIFTRFASTASALAGSPPAFIIAFAVIVVWACTGPIFQYSDTWQIVINTATTIVTFLLVFLIQHTQNRDSKAVQIKLDELIRVTKGAHNALLFLEELDEAEIDSIKKQYCELAEKARESVRSGGDDEDSPGIDLNHNPKGDAA